jgi:pimeloyl-ACP methyl ester carboxylesterase
MLHGIYGRGRNLRTVAQRVVDERPEYACWLVDLPFHGDSPGSEHGETVSALASDIRALSSAQRMQTTAILGHSYGGKVALAFADLQREAPLQVWILDSTPEVKPPAGSAWTMLQIVRSVPRRFARREEAVDALVARGVQLSVAQWMTQNLERGPDGFVWKLDFDVMERLLLDFFNTDLWHVVESPAPGHEIHFVKASESSVLTPEAVGRIENAGPQVQLHHLTGGHWIHAEDPEAVARLLVEHLSAT